MSSIYYCTVFVKDKKMCPNGAGKTTTMNIITGYLAATGGQVTVNGYDILKEPEKAKKSIG